MGATAIGTGLNVPKGYPEKCAAQLAKLTGKPIVPAKDMLAATWDQQGFVVYSSALKSLADQAVEDLERPDPAGLRPARRARSRSICPAMQPGSSIMPGKVNPVIPEVMNVIAFRVMGNDYAVTFAAHCGQLQLNAYEPLEGLAVHGVAGACSSTARMRCATKCVDGITVNEKMLEHYIETTVGIVTALNPVLGYEKATELAAEA